jgi:hypothetical protein
VRFDENPFDTRDGDLVHVSERVNGGTIDTGAHTAAPRFQSWNEKSGAPFFGNQDATAQRSSPELVRPAPGLPSRCHGWNEESGATHFGKQARTVKPVTPLSPPPRDTRLKVQTTIRHHPPANSDSCSTG